MLSSVQLQVVLGGEFLTAMGTEERLRMQGNVFAKIVIRGEALAA